MELRERDGPEPEITEGSLGLALYELKRRLRRRADRKVANALAIECLLLEGLKRGEIQARLGLTDVEWVNAYRWLKEELDAMRGDERADTDGRTRDFARQASDP